MATGSGVGGHVDGFARTHRTDTWWIGPSFTAFVFTSWLLYYFWAAWTAQDFTWGPYLSPAFSPLLMAPPDAAAIGAAEAPHHAWLSATWPEWWPAFVPKSPALFIVAFPGAFRVTCYYYRKAYYRAYFGTPPGCAVGPVPRDQYKGETFLLLFQNLHRYALYFAIALLPFLYVDVVGAFFYEGRFGVGVGTLVIVINAILLSGYTLGCHAWRHLVGGKLNCFSCGPTEKVRFRFWNFTTWLNGRHMEWAWASLLWFAFADLYVRLVSTGTITDLNTWGI